MKSLLLIPVLFIVLKVAGQDHNSRNVTDDDCKFRRVKARCGNISAAARRDVYQRHKFKALNDYTERLRIKYKVSSFYKLLQFTNDVNSSGDPKYDGLRIYFAVNPNSAESDYNKLNLIFVPTIGQAGIHMDDLDSCWIIKPDEDAPVRMTRTDASTWVRKFQDGSDSKYAKFDADGKHRVDSSFEEAKSLWYNVDYLGNKSKGLLNFFNCKLNKMDSIAVQFGGFGSVNEYAYHLTLLFRLSFKNGSKYSVTFTSNTNKYNLKEISNPTKFLYKAGDGTVDTGVPCPPPPTGQTCPGAGALLPQ